MPVFVYEGTLPSGEVRKGTMEAESKQIVMDRLAQQRITPKTVRPKSFLDDLNNIQIGSGVAAKDIVVFTRQFATMIDAGLPLVQCLDILATQSENAYFRKILSKVKEDVESGSTFADALGKHPKVFSPLFVNLVAAGEIGGILDTIMNRLAQYIEKNQKIIKDVKGAMTYPVIVCVMATLIMGVLLTKVIPTFADMFADMGAKLPAPTQMVVDLSNWLVANLIYVIIGIVGAGVGLTTFYRSAKGRQIVDRIVLHLPIMGPIIRKVAVAKFTRTLGTMVASGVPILDGLQIVAKTAGNYVIETAVMYTREKIAEGKNIAEPMMETKVFPSMVVQMIAVGEATGAMDTMLNKIADFYEEEVDAAIAGMKAAMEPIIMGFLGVGIGGLIITMYLPIFTMAGAVGGG
ncbi:MAG: Type II secretion system protein F [Myxococcota bacterium]|nr:Type II secretion system protein F [Myxococcota bacterium]